MPEDPGALWREQPQEETPVTMDDFANRRSSELFSATRMEILMSLAAAVLFLALLAWRLDRVEQRVAQFGVGLVAAWILVSLIWFRNRLRRPRVDVAASGVAFYRRQLEQRRDHLRNAWLWHGPLVLACVAFIATAIGRGYPGVDAVRTALPLALVLAVWTVFGIRRRLRQAKELQREIDELEHM